MKKLIGITGYARSGKDTIFQRSKVFLEKEGIKCSRIAFADALKEELDDLLLKNLNISAFTEKDEEKELIRPLLVTYGTELRRKLNPNCWIERVQDRIKDLLDEGEYVFITDVRFENEAHWIKYNGGFILHVERLGIKPANHEEHTQNVRMRKYRDFRIGWETYGQDNLDKCDEHIIPFLSNLVQIQPSYEQVI